MSGVRVFSASCSKRLTEALLPASTSMTAAPAPARSSGLIQSPAPVMLRLSGKPATLAPSRDAGSPSALLRYSCTPCSGFVAFQVLEVSLGLMTLTPGSSIRLAPLRIFERQGCAEIWHSDRTPEC